MTTSGALPSASKNTSLREQCEREDLVMFINTCFAATNQNEYYNDGYKDTVSITFLHQYVLFNYRTVYVRCLAAGINHFNQSVIILNLLAAGAPSDPQLREEENALITMALRCLPANRAFGLLQQVAQKKINNRRARAIAQHFLAQRREPAFDAVKYRRQYRTIVKHSHIKLGADFSRFLFHYKQQTEFTTPLFETFRQAHYAQTALYKLPYTIAESFVARHNIKRADFLRKIEPKLTRSERLRLQKSAAKASGKPVSIKLDAINTSMTKLVLYVLSIPIKERRSKADELHLMLTSAAERWAAGATQRLGKVALVADCSRSSTGSREKARRPLAIAIAAAYLLEAISQSLHVFYAPYLDSRHADAIKYPFLQSAFGQTALADPVIDALELYPDLLLIVSDGWENDPPQTVAGIIQAARTGVAGIDKINIVHANPVFDAKHFSPKPLSSKIATVGLRDAEDIMTVLEFSAFASGIRNLHALESYLLECSNCLQEQA